MAIVRRNSRIAEKKTAEVAQRLSRSNNRNYDPNFINFVPGGKYKVRLIGFEDDSNPERSTYFIRQKVHTVKLGDGKKVSVICPSTHPGGMKCPICSTCYNWYKSGTEAQKELNKEIKAKFHGYAVAYVISDSTNPENDGTIKLFHYVSQMEDRFDIEIDGISRKYNRDGNNEKDPDALGDDAFFIVGHPDRDFETQSGYDCIITVSKSGQFNDYDVKFTRNKSNVTINEDKLLSSLEALEFDKKYFKKSTDEEVEAFHKKYVASAGMDIGGDVEGDLFGESSMDDDLIEDIPMAQTTSAPVAEPTPTATAVADSITEDLLSPSGVDDIDDLFADLGI